MAGHRLKGAVSASNSTNELPNHPKISRSKRTHDHAFGKEKLSRETGAAPEYNIAESVSFLNAVMANRVVLQTLSAQDILKTKQVCKSWRGASADDITIYNVRGHNLTNDWFFPLFTTNNVGSSQTMQGMWHEHSSISELRKLPPLSYLPPPTDSKAHRCICRAVQKNIEYQVMASSGGLLLVATINAIITHKGFRNPIVRHKPYTCFYRNNWLPLIVTNPLTKLFQVLPFYIPLRRYIAGYGSGLHYHMIVDEVASSYKVLVSWSYGTTGLPPQLVVYDSQCKQWEDVGLKESPRQPSLGGWRELSCCTMYATTCTQGRLYIADIREPTAIEGATNQSVRAFVRLFEADTGTAGQHLILQTEIPLCEAYEVPQPPYPGDNLRNLELVECIGHLYAVIPARKNEYLYEWNKKRDNFWENVVSSAYLPIQFFIFQLDKEDDAGEGHAGVLRIPVPTTRKNCKHITRSDSLSSKLNWSQLDKLIPGQNWFTCTSRGSVIWVTIEDYLLQYNVLSGESTMEILPTELKTQRKLDVAYQASFHMKP